MGEGREGDVDEEYNTILEHAPGASAVHCGISIIWAFGSRQ